MRERDEREMNERERERQRQRNKRDKSEIEKKREQNERALPPSIPACFQINQTGGAMNKERSRVRRPMGCPALPVDNTAVVRSLSPPRWSISEVQKATTNQTVTLSPRDLSLALRAIKPTPWMNPHMRKHIAESDPLTKERPPNTHAQANDASQDARILTPGIFLRCQSGAHSELQHVFGCCELCSWACKDGVSYLLSD